MKTNLIFLFFPVLLLFSSIPLLAQELRIINPGELYASYKFGEDEQEIIVRAIGIEKFNEVVQACREENWPKGMASFEARSEHADLIKTYKVSLLTTFNDRSILQIRPDENRQMPADMQSEKSFYLIMNSSGLNSRKNYNEIMVDDDTEFYDANFPQVMIIDSRSILMNHVFADEEAQQIKDMLGAEGYDFITEHCKEEYWPAGLNSEEKRYSADSVFVLYNAFLVAETGDISILEITPEENTQMASDFLPVETFYIVIKTDGIEILE